MNRDLAAIRARLADIWHTQPAAQDYQGEQAQQLASWLLQTLDDADALLCMIADLETALRERQDAEAHPPEEEPTHTHPCPTCHQARYCKHALATKVTELLERAEVEAELTAHGWPPIAGGSGEEWSGPHHSDDRLSYEATVRLQPRPVSARLLHYCPGCETDQPCVNTGPEGCWACVSGRGFDICPRCMLVALGRPIVAGGAPSHYEQAAWRADEAWSLQEERNADARKEADQPDPWIILSTKRMRQWCKERGWQLTRLTRDRHGYQYRLRQPNDSIYGRSLMYARLASEVITLVQDASRPTPHTHPCPTCHHARSCACTTVAPGTPQECGTCANCRGW